MVYSEVLNQAQWAVSTLYPGQRKELAAAYQTLYSDPGHTVPTPGYKNYLTLKKTVDDLQAAWDATPPADRSAAMASDLDNAKQDLALNGDPGIYAPAATTVQSLTRPSPGRIRDFWKERYSSALVLDTNGNSFAPSDFDQHSAALTSDQWLTLSINQSGADVPLTGVWGFQTTNGGSFAYSDSHATYIKLTFEYVVVPISRQWFDISLFSDRSWRWPTPDHAMVSDGSLVNAGPHGVLPFVGTAAVLARNISVESDMPASEWASVQRAVLETRSVTWGPFLVAGRYFGHGQRAFAGRRLANTLLVTDAQVVGFITTALPRSPNPDPQFDWGNH